jgi:predicted dehydrogenase
MLKIGVVGLGWWSEELTKAIHGKTGKLRIVGGTARSLEKRQAFAERYAARAYESYDAMLRDPGVDAILLTTPHSLHAAHVIAAAEAGKHVFVEKPLALTADTAAAAVDACKRHGVVLAVGHNRRFAAGAGLLKRMVAEGAFGTILHVEANFSAPSALNYTPERWRASRVESPAGGLAGLGIHMIDIMVWLLGPIARLVCQARHRALKVDMDDTTSALLEFAGGMTGYLGTQCAAPYTTYLRILGTAANAEARSDFAELALHKSGGQPEAVPLPKVDTLHAELEAFAAACAGGPAFPVGLDEAVHGVAVMETMATSAARGGAWLPVVAAEAASAARKGHG